MAMNRVQFQPGLSMHGFMELNGTAEQCEAASSTGAGPRATSARCAGGPTLASRRFVASACCTGSAEAVRFSAA